MRLGISGSQTSKDFLTYYFVQKYTTFTSDYNLYAHHLHQYQLLQFTEMCSLIVHLCLQRAQQEELDKIEKHMKSTKGKENAKPLDKPEQ